MVVCTRVGVLKLKKLIGLEHNFLKTNWHDFMVDLMENEIIKERMFSVLNILVIGGVITNMGKVRVSFGMEKSTILFWTC